MRTEREVEDLIKRLLKSLEGYAGEDEWTAERTGWLYALHWILKKEMPKGYYKSDMPDIERSFHVG